MKSLLDVIDRYGNSDSEYYAALRQYYDRAGGFAFDERLGAWTVGERGLCEALLRDHRLRRPDNGLARSLESFRSDLSGDYDLALSVLSDADDIMRASTMFANGAISRPWRERLALVASSGGLVGVARRHADRLPTGVEYDFAEVARRFVSECAFLLAGVRPECAIEWRAPIEAAVDLIDGRAASLGDTIRAAAGLRYLVERLRAGQWDVDIEPELVGDAVDRAVLLVAAHESTAYAIAGACMLWHHESDESSEALLRRQLLRDPPIQSITRCVSEPLQVEHVGLCLKEGEKVIIHLGAASGGGTKLLAFGAGRHACPGTDMAMAQASAFITSFRQRSGVTAFCASRIERQTSVAARKFLCVPARTS